MNKEEKDFNYFLKNVNHRKSSRGEAELKKGFGVVSVIEDSKLFRV